MTARAAYAYEVENHLKRGRDPKCTWQTPGWAQTDDHPVVNVSWNDALAFCEWLSGKEGKAYRLPTEAEWEHACRAGSQTRYCFGDYESGLDFHAWHLWNAYGVDKGYAHEVGRMRANAWGLYDMHGNVGEWCSDWYDSDYYENSPVGNPTWPSIGTYRVIRGGGWRDLPGWCRSASRGFHSPDGSNNDWGFRVALDPAE